MNTRRLVSTLIAWLAVTAAGAAAGQQETAPGGAEMPPEFQAMMEAWQKAGTPGDHHAWLSESAGEWEVRQTLWMQPGAEPTLAEGRAVRTVLFDGRVLEERYSSQFLGQAYSGMGHSGYDNAAGKYWATWMDNMSTTISTGHGTCEDDHSHCTFNMRATDPMTGGDHLMRIEVTYAEGQEKHEFHEKHGDIEVKTMELVYTRASSGG